MRSFSSPTFNAKDKATVKNKRPININPLKYRYPPMAIASILHRISGVIVFLFIPVLLWMLSASLGSPERFIELQSIITSPLFKFIIWATLSALFLHLLIGVRHLIMDLGVGEHLKSAKFSATFVISLGIILAILLGVWLW